MQAEPDSTNVYIGNISAEVTEVELKQLADRYGVVVEMRLHRKGGYAFVQVLLLCLNAIPQMPACFPHVKVFLLVTHI